MLEEVIRVGAMKSYLSIDMDYWFNNFDDNTSEKVKNTYIPFINKVESCNVPIFFCNQHDEILQDLNKYKVDRLYNVDYHSDIIIEPEETLDEGTWASFYRFRSNCIFEWRMPDRYMCVKSGMGLCHARSIDTFPRTKFGYKKSKTISGLNGIEWNSIIAIGICESPEWINEEGYSAFWDFKSKITDRR